MRGIDDLSEVAVIKIKDDQLKGLPVAAFADSDKVRVGEFAIAVGTPYALDYTVTVGHVSAKGRANVVPPWMNGNNMDQDFIQTDANINPGNSGGPLVNLEGRVIGINTMIRGIGTGIGFAIPSNLARTIADELIKTGKYERAWLGVAIADLKDVLERETIAPGVKYGLLVTGIPKGAPAAASDLRPADIIVSVNNRPVKNIQDLRAEVRSKPLGSTLDIGVIRKGSPLQIKVSTGHLPETNVARTRPRRAGGTPATGRDPSW
ncbi:MAG: PDZ domain-containing protein [Rhodospirillales bacterium]|nr:PDZ domain-containing protein [Rhodospirillales bacterium]